MAELTPHEVAALVELTEAHALADWWGAIPEPEAAELGTTMRHFGDAVLITTRQVPDPFMNRVVGLGITAPATEEMVDALVTCADEVHARPAVQLSPAARPAELATWLETRGWQRSRNWVKLYRGTGAPPAITTTLRIVPAGPDQAQILAAITIAAFEMPPLTGHMVTAVVGRSNWRHYLAYDGHMPVAVGALYLDGIVGWLGNAATLPSHRNRGAQGALMARRIQDALDLGCRWLVTETGEETPEAPNPSYRNMLRTGFQRAYTRPNYVLPSGIGG
ncbi:MAG TPA: GNAT family N-acetyltransferase [Chloroflexia bacterium]|nr:GNAT family N-acetyltransferase [Chloroflexia bacterium]